MTAASIPGLRDWLRLVLMYRAPHPDSQRILDVMDRMLDRPYKTSALIHGEPGTGKEGLARALHQAMHGGTAPFVKMPTGGRDPDVLALHLFGTRERRGAIARAEGGTLFLDEVGTLPREIQARLSPVIRGRYRRNDDEAPQPCNVTVMAATDHSLPTLVRDGQFRHDLYYRLSRLELTLPALRERPSDVPRAALWALNRILADHGVGRPVSPEGEVDENAVVLEREASDLLMAQPWHGNFRELDRFMERLYFLESDGERITADNVKSLLR